VKIYILLELNTISWGISDLMFSNHSYEVSVLLLQVGHILFPNGLYSIAFVMYTNFGRHTLFPRSL